MLTLKGDLEQVINLTLDLINDHLGKGSSSAEAGDDRAGASNDGDPENFNKPKKKSRWAEPAPILPIKPWQVGESCQAIYPGTEYCTTTCWGSV